MSDEIDAGPPVFPEGYRPELDPGVHAPQDWDGESYCWNDGCQNPATHHRIHGMDEEGNETFTMECCSCSAIPEMGTDPVGEVLRAAIKVVKADRVVNETGGYQHTLRDLLDQLQAAVQELGGWEP